MLNNFLKPSIQSLENNLKMNINDLKTKIGNSLPSTENMKHQDFDESKLQESSIIKSSSNRNGEGHMDTKISEINKLGERLYEKLLEKVNYNMNLKYKKKNYLSKIEPYLNLQKEKKLNELKHETTNYLKKKINTSNNTNLLNSGC